MDKYLTFDNEETFNAVCSVIDQYLGYPTPDGKTLTYATPILRHPGNDRIAMPIFPAVEACLTVEQREQLLSYEQMVAEGWFNLPPGFTPPPPPI